MWNAHFRVKTSVNASRVRCLSCCDHTSPGGSWTLFNIAQTCSHSSGRLGYREIRKPMLEKWNVIARQISTETDSERLVTLVREADLLLHSAQNLRHVRRSITQPPNKRP